MNNTKRTKIKKCTTCKGSGKIRVCNERELHNMDIEVCSDCWGEGSYIIVTTVEYFRKTNELVEPLIR
jgi:DnaJ-class molecular chaperone